MNFDLSRLSYFYRVAQEGSFSGASKVLRVQQPAISRMIALLEDEMGVKLLERFSRGVKLTEAGKIAYEHCAKIFEESDRMQARLVDGPGTFEGEVYVAANESIATYYLPAVIKEVLRIYPKLIPRVVTGSSEHLAAPILDGRIDFGLFYTLDPGSPLQVENLGPVFNRVVVATEHRNKNSVLESFIGSREIDHTATKSFPTLRMLQKSRPKTAIKISCGSQEAQKQLVLSGLGVAILPEPLIVEDLKSKKLTVVNSQYRFESPIKLALRPRKSLSRGAVSLIEALRVGLKK